MAEKTKLKWLRKEFSSSEELEYYLTQLKHQDKLKSDIIALLERFQHLLFQDYEPDFLTIAYNGRWDVSFGPTAIEEPKKIEVSSAVLKSEATKSEPKKYAKTPDVATKTTKAENKAGSKEDLKSKTVSRPITKEEVKPKATVKFTKEEKKKRLLGKTGERIDLTDLINANFLSAGTKLKHKTQTNVLATVTRDGNLKVGKEEYSSPSSAATSLANSGRRDGWLCWLFQDGDGDWKPIDLLRTRWKEKVLGK